RGRRREQEPQRREEAGRGESHVRRELALGAQRASVRRLSLKRVAFPFALGSKSRDTIVFVRRSTTTYRIRSTLRAAWSTLYMSNWRQREPGPQGWPSSRRRTNPPESVGSAAAS